MSCCNKVKASRSNCPTCHQPQKSVGVDVLRHHLVSPLNQHIEAQGYYFCANTHCSTVYFGENGQEYTQQQVRGVVGQKQTSPTRPLCYCFDISAQQVIDELNNTGSSPSKDFVIAQTKAQSCACQYRNPSGACCLADFPS